MTSHPVIVPTLRSWIMVLTASLFFFYEFIQLNMFNVISGSLMQAFNMDAEQLGILSAFYLAANVIFLFPAGMLLDRCATRKVILTSLGICILGTILLSQSTSFALACISRFLTGIGSAFCFLSVIRLSSRWFPANKMALVTGVVVTMAMAGGMVAQTPLALLVNAVSWRYALLIDAAFGVLVFIVIASVVQDYSQEYSHEHDVEQQQIHAVGYWKSMRLAFLRFENWLGGIYVALMNLPIGLLGGLWGVLYLMHTHGLSQIQATNVSMMLFLGTIIGGPIVGWVSDRLGMRRPPMLVGALVSLVVFLDILFVPTLGNTALSLLFLLLGITTSTQIISYPLVAENSPRFITAMSVSVVNITVQSADGLLQPFFGYLLDHHALYRLHYFTTQLVASDFQWAMWLFPVGFVLAILVVIGLRETYCKERE